jgi:hypothetical protein
MARTKSKPNLEALRQQQLELVKKIREAEAEAKKEQQEKDDRRKLIAGAIALKEHDANKSGDFATALRGLLHQKLTRPADRALFDLPALPDGGWDGAGRQASAADGTQHGGGYM